MVVGEQEEFKGNDQKGTILSVAPLVLFLFILYGHVPFIGQIIEFLSGPGLIIFGLGLILTGTPHSYCGSRCYSRLLSQCIVILVVKRGFGGHSSYYGATCSGISSSGGIDL